MYVSLARCQVLHAMMATLSVRAEAAAVTLATGVAPRLIGDKPRREPVLRMGCRTAGAARRRGTSTRQLIAITTRPGTVLRRLISFRSRDEVPRERPAAANAGAAACIYMLEAQAVGAVRRAGPPRQRHNQQLGLAVHRSLPPGTPEQPGSLPRTGSAAGSPAMRGTGTRSPDLRRRRE